MSYSRVKKRPQKDQALTGVYADLDDLVRLQFKAAGFSFLPRQPIHSILSGRHASRLRGRGLNFEELRHYLPGDDIRNMDWKVTARTREPHVRVYTEERDRPVLLVVDQRISMFFGSRRAMKSVVAAEIAALSAWRVLSVGDRVGAIVFNDAGMAVFEPHRSREQVMRILGGVVEMNHGLTLTRPIKPNPGILNQVLEKAVRLAKHDFLICLIGDATGGDGNSVRSMTRLTAHNDALIVFIHDPLEADLPDTGRIVVSEEALQLEVDTGDKKLRRRFSEDFNQRYQWMKEMSRLRAVPVLTLSTARPCIEQVQRQLGYMGTS